MCMFLLFSWRILPQTEFLRSRHSIPSVTVGHSQLTTWEIIAMCKAAKTVRTVFYVTKIPLKQLLSWPNASDQQSWMLSEDGINCVGSDQLINIKLPCNWNCQNDLLKENMTVIDKKSHSQWSDLWHNSLIMSSDLTGKLLFWVLVFSAYLVLFGWSKQRWQKRQTVRHSINQQSVFLSSATVSL